MSRKRQRSQGCSTSDYDSEVEDKIRKCKGEIRECKDEIREYEDKIRECKDENVDLRRILEKNLESLLQYLASLNSRLSLLTTELNQYSAAQLAQQAALTPPKKLVKSEECKFFCRLNFVLVL